MKVIQDISILKAEINRLRAAAKRVGLVPTMGSLHEGHLSLVRESVRTADCTVVSIFVNPTQFGPQEDFARYPRDTQHDLGLLKKENVDIVFMPDAIEVYPEGYKTYVEVHDLQDRLCGRSRPGHFRGVCTIVLKLLNMVRPDVAFFGQKDAQQAVIIRCMVKDLDLDVRIEILPIVRDDDGLALSSRNTYLTKEQRRQALALSRSLNKAQKMVEEGERRASTIIQRMSEVIQAEPETKIDYVEIVDLENIDPLEKIETGALVAVAAFIGRVRLIDNTVVKIKEKA